MPELPGPVLDAMSAVMERLFGNPSYTHFVLQDRKRLPARFFARVAGAMTSLIG